MKRIKKFLALLTVGFVMVGLLGFQQGKAEASTVSATSYTAFKGTLAISVALGNVREVPSSTGNILTTLPEATVVQAFEKTITDGVAWYHITYSGTKIGWVTSAIVSVATSTTDALLISADSGNVRDMPSKSGIVLTTLTKGTKIQSFEKVTIEGTDWYHVYYSGTKTGWVTSEIVRIAPVPTAYNASLYIAVASGNVRDYPSETGYVIDALSQDTVVQAYEKATMNGIVWYHVTYNGTKTGWVTSAIVKAVPTPTAYPATLSINVALGNVRDTPSPSGVVLTTLAQNVKIQSTEKVTIDGTTWYHIYYSGTKMGWVTSAIVTVITPPPTAYSASLVISPTTGDKIMDTPSSTGKMVTNLQKGTPVQAFEKTTEKTATSTLTWYHVTYNSGANKGWIVSTSVATAPTSVLLNVPVIFQLPDLPRGCEVTSLAMMLQNAGIKNADKMTLAKAINTVPYQYSNGLMGNPNEGFVGNMYTLTQKGYGVYHAPVTNLSKKYLTTTADMSGQSFDSVLTKLNQGKPVWIITNTTYAQLPSSAFTTWKTSSGNIQITMSEHSVLVTGYDANYIYFNDPLTNAKNKKVSKTNFISAWEQMGKQAISY